MSTMTTGTIAKALWPGVNKFYGDEYKRFPLVFKRIFKTMKSDKKYEEDVSLSGFGQFAIKTEGGSISYDAARQGYVKRYTAVTYALGFQATREYLEDMQYDIIFKKAQALGMSARITQETIAANVLNRAFDSAYLGGDAKEMCATDHPNIAGGTFSNELTTAADLSEAAIEQALIDIAGFTDDRGNQIMVTGRQLVIPRQEMFNAKRILKSDLRSGTAENDLNALKGEDLEIVQWNFLTDPDAWFIVTDAVDGLKHVDRRGIEFGSDNDTDTENAKFKCTFRADWGWSDPRGIFGSGGA